MANRVDLDAMIPREDFGVVEDTFSLDLMSDFPIRHLAKDAPVLKLLRKPDFQRETNHWTPDQLVTFIKSFVDGEVIPSLILWKAPSYIFVIDGGHRLSALRAWMEDDYGDKHLSKAFYKNDISKKQIEVAQKARKLVEKQVGRYTDLVASIDLKSSDPAHRRAQVVATRALPLQWIQGSAATAESSFYKINSQGTPLDETETTLIKNRHRPIAIGARAIVRAGSGHKYWSAFSPECVQEVERVTAKVYEDVFKPEMAEPVRTLELPVGGSVSPVDALALLIEFLSVAGTRQNGVRSIEQYPEDATGSGTVEVLKNASEILNKISGTSSGSLGLHPAVYFYNEKAKYSRFLFLGVVTVIQEKLRNNNSEWFRQFTSARAELEKFLVENKSVIGMLIVNLSKGQRVSKIRDLIEFLVREFKTPSTNVTIEQAIATLGLTGRIVDVRAVTTSPNISDDTKAAVYMRDALPNALRCPICGGILDSSKSVTYDHINRVRTGGTGDVSNIQMAHPYCNSGYKN
jgi:hypothetical protein